MNYPERRLSAADHENLVRQLPVFQGYPYLLTRVVVGLYHISLLPQLLSHEQLKAIGVRQIKANRLEACVVFGSDYSLYLYPEGFGAVSDGIPQGGRIALDRLHLGQKFPEDEDLQRRKELLADYAKMRNSGGPGYLLGDPTKGGRPAGNEDLRLLSGHGLGGIPKGLTRCSECQEWRGECLDPNPVFEDLVMTVNCLCENHNLCARCYSALHDRRLNANYFNEVDGQIWHVPGFCAFEHRCE